MSDLDDLFGAVTEPRLPLQTSCREPDSESAAYESDVDHFKEFDMADLFKAKKQGKENRSTTPRSSKGKEKHTLQTLPRTNVVFILV